jgi:hypothetical protein
MPNVNFGFEGVENCNQAAKITGKEEREKGMAKNAFGNVTD